MSLGSVVLLSVIWLAMFNALTGESFHNNGNHRSRHKYKRRQLFSGEHYSNMHFHQDSLPLQLDPSLLLIEEDNEATGVDPTFELDKPRERLFILFSHSFYVCVNIYVYILFILNTVKFILFPKEKKNELCNLFCLLFFAIQIDKIASYW